MEGEDEEEDDLQVDSDDDVANLMEEPVENLFNSQDVAEHLDELLGKEDQGGFVTIPQLNYSIPWRTVEDVADNELAKFTAESSGDLFTQDAQVSTFSFSFCHEKVLDNVFGQFSRVRRYFILFYFCGKYLLF